MRKFDVDAIDSGLTQYWSSLSSLTSSFLNAPNVIINPNLAAGSTGYSLSHSNIITFATNAEGKNVFKINPNGTANAIRSTAIQTTSYLEEWYFECRVRSVVAPTLPSNLIITAEVFTDGANAASVNVSSSGVVTTTLTSEWKTISGYYTVEVANRNGIRFRLFHDATSTNGELEVSDFKMTRKNGFELAGQVPGVVSSIAFQSNPLVNNRNICKGSTTSISLTDVGAIVTSSVPVEDFAFSFLVQPNTSDLWLIKVGDVDAGVQIKADTSIQLSWPVTTQAVDEDGNLTSSTTMKTQSLVYSEDTSFISFSRTGNTASLSVNGKVVSIEGDDISFSKFQFGGGTGTALIDKIAYSTNGIQVKLANYVNLFKSQRLDTVPRPEGNTGFSYLLDSSAPDVSVYDRFDFEQLDDYQYINYYNPFETGVIRVDKRASFPIEYTVDQGLNWLTLPTKLKLPDYYSNVILRHQDMSDEAFYVQIVSTSLVSIPMAFHDVLVTGDVYLPSEVGFGYYDADPGDFYDATVRLTSNEGAAIRTLEMLAIINSTTGVLNTDTGVPAGTWYVNGVPRALSTVKPDQLYHLVFVSDVNMPWVEVTQGHQVEIVGVGASDIAYAQSDAYYIFNTFAGNPLITALEDVDVLVDGVSDSGDAASLLDLQWNK